MGTDNPKEMLREGRKARNLTNVSEAALEAAEKGIMTLGVREKFNQNPDLKAFLLSTTNSRIGESSPSNKRWGTGFYLTHKDAYNTNLWADNDLGDIIQAQRDSYQN
jgi:hypothetical protein